MQKITYYTDAQFEVEKWINQLGFRTELEYPVGKYCLDIYIPELNWGVEVDGSCHIFRKSRDKKRDKEIIEKYKIDYIFRVRNDSTEEDFKKSFIEAVKEIKGDYDSFEERA